MAEEPSDVHRARRWGRWEWLIETLRERVATAVLTTWAVETPVVQALPGEAGIEAPGMGNKKPLVTG
jgi:hypothetical protein